METPERITKTILRHFRMTPEGHRLLAALAAKNGVSQAAILELLIRQEARRQRVV